MSSLHTHRSSAICSLANMLLEDEVIVIRAVRNFARLREYDFNLNEMRKLRFFYSKQSDKIKWDIEDIALLHVYFSCLFTIFGLSLLLLSSSPSHLHFNGHFWLI